MSFNLVPASRLTKQQTIRLDFSGECNWIDLLCASIGSTKTESTTKTQKAASQHVCGADDWDLAQKIVGGDEDAFISLVEQHKSRVTCLVSRFANRVVDRDEIVNETFAEVYFCLPKFRGDAKLSTWISTVATRLCFRFLKRKDTERKRRALLRWVGWPSGLADYREAQEQDSAREKLESLLEVLSAEDRMVLTLLYWEECSVAEVAQRLDWSESKIKVRAHRAREKMKQFSEGKNGRN